MRCACARASSPKPRATRPAPSSTTRCSARGTTATPDDLLLRLGRARLAAGDRDGAVEAFTRLHEVYPLSDLAPTAAAQLTDLDAWAPLEEGSARYGKELKRAERLFAARRYAQARDAFEALLPVVRI